MASHEHTLLLKLTTSTSDCIYLFALLPVTDDIKSLNVRNMPLSATNFIAASDFGY